MDDEQKRVNGEILHRLDAIEMKLDQAAGAWWFIKLFASVAVGIVVTWNVVQGWFK